jgi:hypothetical protein
MVRILRKFSRPTVYVLLLNGEDRTAGVLDLPLLLVHVDNLAVGLLVSVNVYSVYLVQFSGQGNN